jgi:DNA anti-recombination protein RmuC
MKIQADVSFDASSWESQLDRLSSLYQICLATGNYGPMHAWIASDLNGDVDHQAVFSQTLITSASIANDNGALERLMNVNIGQIKEIRDGFNKNVEQLLRKISDDSKADELQDALENLIDTMQKLNNDSWEKSRQNGKSIIKTLPADLRPSAARIFSGALAPVSTITEQQIQSLVKALETAEGEKPGWLHRLKAGLHEALAVNQAVARAAIQYTEAIYKLEDKQASCETGLLPGHSIDEIPVDDLGVDRLYLRKTSNGWEVCDCTV